MYRRIVRAAAVLGLVLASASGVRANALTCVDAPRPNAIVPPSFYIAGWALDLASRQDAGISQVHVWAYPRTGAAPVFLGQIARGARPDVAAAFGPQFVQSGFWVAVTNLTPGGYLLVLTPFSSIANAFQYDAAFVVPITVAAPASAPPPGRAGSELRVLQWNTHHGGYGTDGGYSPDRLASWAAQMRPDVIMFNEIERNDFWGRQDQPAIYQALLQQKTGRRWYAHFAQEFGQWDAAGKGNLILSTYPFTASDRYELVRNGDRSIAAASIAVNGRTITLVSTHLDPYDPALRLVQASEVTSWSAVQPENRIVAGDMNAWPDQTSIAQFTQTYYDSWAVAAANGAATAFPGNAGETKNGRIDYIFYSRGANLSVKSSQVFDTRDASGQMPSDHRPVLTTFVVR